MEEKSEEKKPELRKLFRKVGLSVQDRFQTVIKRPWADVQQEIERNTRSLQEENAHRVVDKPTEQMVAYSCVNLASYRTLITMIDKDQVLKGMSSLICDLLKERVEQYLVSRIGITQDAPEKAFEMVRTNFKKRAIEQAGRWVNYEQKCDQTRCTFILRKCLFNDFYRENGAPELIPALCKGDYVWIEELNKPKYMLKVERTKCLSEGDDSCDFVFNKVMNQ